MKSALLVGWSAFVCQILAQVNIPAVQDFDPQKFAGPWHLIVMVMDNFVHDDIATVNVTATPLGSQDVLLKIVISKREVCYLEKVQLIQTQQPGVFNIFGKLLLESCTAANQLGYPFKIGCDVTVHMVEVDYDSYFLLHFTTMNNRILHLYTRREKKLHQQKKQFRKAARFLKFDLNKKIFEPRNIECYYVLEKNPFSYS